MAGLTRDLGRCSGTIGNDSVMESVGEMAMCRGASLGLGRRRFMTLGLACLSTTPALAGCSNDDGPGAVAGGTDGSTGFPSGGSSQGDLGSSDGAADGDGSDNGTVAGDDAGPAATDSGPGTSSEESGSSDEEEPGETGSGEGGVEVDFDPGAIPEDVALFPRTVMAGEMLPESVMLAVYAEDAQPKTLRMWRPSESDGQVVVVEDRQVEPDSHGFVKVRVEGLNPGTWYSYAFFSGDAADGFDGRSLIGEVRTALAPDAEEAVTIAIAACNGGYVDPAGSSPFSWETMRVLGDEYYDAFVHLGDQAYMDEIFSAGGSYEQYLEAWGAYHGGGYRDVFPRGGLYCTWDDHEVTDNGAVDPWSRAADDITRIENAIRAYYTVLPIDAADSTDRLWRSFRWGRTVEIIMLDSRYERTPKKVGEYLSEAQMAFLEQRLRDSPCRFKVIANSVPFSDLSRVFLGVAAGDRWDGYPQQRQRVIDFVDDNAIPNVYWIAGDIHTNFIGNVQRDPGEGLGSRMKEVCVTAGNSNPAAFSFALLGGDQFSYSTGDPRACTLTFDPANETVQVRFLNPDGSLAHEETLAQ